MYSFGTGKLTSQLSQDTSKEGMEWMINQSQTEPISNYLRSFFIEAQAWSENFPQGTNVDAFRTP